MQVFNITLHYIIFIAPPIWIEKPNDVTSTIGSPISVQCVSSGKPPPQISWYKFQGNILITICLNIRLIRLNIV